MVTGCRFVARRKNSTEPPKMYRPSYSILSLLQSLNKRNIVAFQQDLAQLSSAAIRTVLRVRVLLCALLHLHRIVDDQVHELIETADLSLDAHAQLLEEPDLHCRVLLEELEDEVDGR